MGVHFESISYWFGSLTHRCRKGNSSHHNKLSTVVVFKFQDCVMEQDRRRIHIALSVRSFLVEMPRGSCPCFILFRSSEIELFLKFFGDWVLQWWLFVDTPPYYLPLPGVKPWHLWNRWWMRHCKWTRLLATLSLSRAERGNSGDVPWTYWNRWWRKTFQEQLWPTIACSRQIWSGSRRKSCWKIYREFCRSASSRTIVSWMSMAKVDAGN